MNRPYGRRAQQGIEKFLRFGFAKRRQAQLRVIRLAPPLLSILGAVVHQQENAGTRDTLAQGIEEALGLSVDPVQVFKDEDKGLVETLAEEELFECLKGPSPPNLRVHLLEAGSRIFEA